MRLVDARSLCGLISVSMLVSPAVPQEREDGERAATVLDRLRALGAQELAKPGSDPADVQAKAAELGYDVDRTFAFVRDELEYEPYRGILRGPQGTLSARAGNSWDKSLLLRALLRAGGHEVRLRSGALPSEKAEALVRRFLSSDPMRGLLGRCKSVTRIDEAALKVVPLEASRDFAGPAVARGSRVFAELEESAEREARGLRSALERAGVEFGSTAQELAARAIEHVWVQVRRGSKWVDLDPCFEGSRPGEIHAAKPSEAKEDNALRHRVVFRLVYRRAVDDREREETILQIPVFADEALACPPVFLIDPADDDLPSVSKIMEMTPHEAADLFSKIRHYQAQVRVGNRSFASRPFDLSGQIFDVSAGGQIEELKGLGKKTGGLLEDFVEEKKRKLEFLELAVDLSIEGPGASARNHRRTLLRKRDLEDDHFPSPILWWEILIQSQLIPPALPARWAVRAIADAAGPLAATLRKGSVAPEELDRAASREVDIAPHFLARFALGRQAAMAGLCAKFPGVRPLFDGPNVVIAERRVCVKRAAGELCSRMSIDIVENAVTFVSRENPAAAAEAALRQGIFDTFLEARMLQNVQPGALYSPLCDFERARIAGVSLTVAAPDRLESTGISENDRAWIRAYETKERRIVAPSSKVRESGCGWWSMDPRTGSVVGRAAGGRGWASNHPASDPGPPSAVAATSSQGATEYPVLLKRTTLTALTAG